MNNVKKAATQNTGRKFPPEAFEWNDDVTKDAVDRVREDVRHLVEGGDWEVIDGFGRSPTR